MLRKIILAMDQFTLFEESPPTNASDRPLAHKHRPDSPEEYQGFQTLISKYPFLAQAGTKHLIIWGPPGCGKTSLVHLLAKRKNQRLHTLNAVLQGIPDLKKTLSVIRPGEALFIDEIHRFNKAQQDALLPSVERGDFVFYGATTENPFVSLNPALRSRVTILQLQAASTSDTYQALKNICDKEEKSLEKETLEFLAGQAQGDMRLGINLLEIAFEIGDNIPKLRQTFRDLNLDTADAVDRYYDLISALIKSMRGSDPDAALLYLASLIHEGHDLIAVCRRLIIFASEDIGNADPTALTLANECLKGFQNVGLPEGRIILGHTVTYLASTLKSNRAYQAINEALSFVAEKGPIEIPTILKNKKSDQYQYPHSFPGSFIKQQYSAVHHPKFYQPSELGREGQFKSRLESLWK